MSSISPDALYTNVSISNIFNITLDELFDDFKEKTEPGLVWLSVDSIFQVWLSGMTAS